jgi:hypothetical protein
MTCQGSSHRRLRAVEERQLGSALVGASQQAMLALCWQWRAAGDRRW